MNSRTSTSATTALAAMTGAALILSLTACANIDDLVHQRHQESFPTSSAAADGWVGVDIPSWIPDDATDLHNIASTDETVAVVRATTDSPLEGDCTMEDRHGIPVFAADWSTDAWPDTVWRCGDYEVMSMDDGWLGWFNAAEPGQTPG